MDQSSTDRELLERAAKAACIRLDGWSEYFGGFNTTPTCEREVWNGPIRTDWSAIMRNDLARLAGAAQGVPVGMPRDGGLRAHRADRQLHGLTGAGCGR